LFLFASVYPEVCGGDSKFTQGNPTATSGQRQNSLATIDVSGQKPRAFSAQRDASLSRLWKLLKHLNCLDP